MKKSNYLMLVLGFTFLLNPAYSQKSGLSLTFTAIDDAATVQLDSVKVMNRTQGGDTTIYWPNTVLVLDYLGGVHDINSNTVSLQVFQNYPNPVTNQSTISLYVPEKDEVGILIMDVLGRVILKLNRVLERGFHSFRFTPSSGNLFFFTAQWRGMGSSIKILNAASDAGREASLEYQGGESWTPHLKASKDIQSFMFKQGDTLLYVGYANALQSGRLDTPSASQTYTLQFATNIPCPGTFEVAYEGENYYTVQIFSQCWLKENLNVGSMIPGSQEMADNEVIEKYCYNDLEDNCYQYGGLYRWDELMQYNLQQGVQGICPPGWHLPTDEEWKVLEGAADSQYGIGDPNWDNEIYRDYDAGLNLKNTYGWLSGSNGTDLFGFSGLPGGQYEEYTGSFSYIESSTWWWSSTESDINQAWSRRVYDQMPGAGRYSDYKDYSFSARCLMNEIVIASPVVTTDDITDITQTSATSGGNVTDEGSSAIMERGVCWSTAQNPTINDPHTIDGSGIGSFSSNLTGLSANTIYYVRAYALNSEGTAYGNEKTFTTVYSPFNCGDVVNYYGEDYNTVQIGSQCWLKENLNLGTMINGNSNQTNNSTIEKYCYGNDPSNCGTYGGLYQLAEMMQYTTQEGVQGICPTGWHIPTDAEWCTLTQFVDPTVNCNFIGWSGTDGGTKMKTTSGWDSGGGGTNESGFTALPGGHRDYDGNFVHQSTHAGFWSSSMSWYRGLFSGLPTIDRNSLVTSDGRSVRCLKDN